MLSETVINMQCLWEEQQLRFLSFDGEGEEKGPPSASLPPCALPEPPPVLLPHPASLSQQQQPTWDKSPRTCPSLTSGERVKEWVRTFITRQWARLLLGANGSLVLCPSAMTSLCFGLPPGTQCPDALQAGSHGMRIEGTLGGQPTHLVRSSAAARKPAAP